ncbi:MAG: tyrosine-type recombinase/integrase, partial [Alphaproteobacteria bacterium]|nr:tyrosine-type recombinase/integrase [Alphaproteobacteria bacterium]
MAARERMKLTDAAIARLRPRGREYSVWDSRVAGLGVRVRPTGGRSYVLLLDAGGRTKRVSLGPVSTKSVADARREVLGRHADPQPEKTAGPAAAVPLFRDFVAGPWKEVHFARYKPSGQRTASWSLERQLLPAFGTRPLDRITPAHVRRWFERYSRTAPGGANRSLGILGQILNFAVACGHVETNPATGIAFNRRPALTRFLSREEIARLHGVLDARTGKGRQQQADIIRLLLLTGCRKGEVMNLRWTEVHDGMLALADAKTGARTVPLGSRARAILDRQPRGESPFVFPSPLDPARPRGPALPLWYRVRKEAGIEDCRLHDLRHTMASHAVMNGVPVPVVSRMLGHSNVRMTLRYAHLADRDIEAAAERVALSHAFGGLAAALVGVS